MYVFNISYTEENMKKYVLECCVDSVESAIEAEKGGADRIELAANLIIGGTSPSMELYREIRKQTDIDIFVLLRPRFGDFNYTENEFKILKSEIAAFRDAGADGVVIGCLKEDGTLDMERMKELVDEAGHMHVSLHRAFDMTRDPFESLEQAKQLGIKTILTSGHKNTAPEGKELIKELVEKAGDDIEILVGSGVNADVIRDFMNDTEATAFHLSGKVTLESKMEYRKEGVNMGLPMMSEYEIIQTSADKIKQARDVIDANRK